MIRSGFFAAFRFGWPFWSLEKSARMDRLDSAQGASSVEEKQKKHSQIVAVSKHINRPTIYGLMMGGSTHFFQRLFSSAWRVLWWEPAQRQCVSMLPCHVAMVPHMALQVSSTLPTTSPAEYTQHAHCQKKLIFEFISVHIRHKSTESTYQHASNSQQAAPIYISQNSMPDLSWISFTQQQCLGYTCFKWGPFRVDFAELFLLEVVNIWIRKPQ